MGFSVRFLEEGDYEKLLPWWKWHRFTAPPKEMLPQNGKGGIMVSKNRIDICAGFLYRTDSKIAWMEFIISNPNYREKDRVDAIKLLIEQLCLIAKQQGYKAVFTSVKHHSLINHFKSTGFTAEKGKSTEMVRALG